MVSDFPRVRKTCYKTPHYSQSHLKDNSPNNSGFYLYLNKVAAKRTNLDHRIVTTIKITMKMERFYTIQVI